jgi:hypothetical protein
VFQRCPVSEDPGAGESRFDLDAAAKNRLRLNRVRFEVPVIHGSHSSERDVVAVRVVSDPGRPTGGFNEERVEAWILDDDLLAADRPNRRAGGFSASSQVLVTVLQGATC